MCLPPEPVPPPPPTGYPLPSALLLPAPGAQQAAVGTSPRETGAARGPARGVSREILSEGFGGKQAWACGLRDGGGGRDASPADGALLFPFLGQWAWLGEERMGTLQEPRVSPAWAAQRGVRFGAAGLERPAAEGGGAGGRPSGGSLRGWGFGQGPGLCTWGGCSLAGVLVLDGSVRTEWTERGRPQP